MNATSELKWDVQQRLKLLECTVLLTGWVRTQALIETFGISRAQASKDFAVYHGLRPENLIYNKSRKYYEASAVFEPLLLSGKASELLDALPLMQSGAPVVALSAQSPAMAMVKPLERELDWSLLRAVSRAICQQIKLQVSYQSMNRPEPAVLTLSPHTLVYNGFRWHVRAFSDTHEAYRDFVLARMRGPVVLLTEQGIPDGDDTAWHTLHEVAIVPHPELPPAQQAVIAEDYGMTDGRIVQPVRQALIPYFLRMMQIDPRRLDPDPRIQQIVLQDVAAVRPYLWS
ncbi:WYL domain-containing transcriptional regulator [Halothiobacillus diazotrophicus]|uniref:WYL domain-containing protein n=1 Tax=Halothiobacillus diazotrophicus TaxID=1860122 RepID=UPI0009EEE3DA|nr:WYL domain-containing protein [Halothiobacillus diazotrophicus]